MKILQPAEALTQNTLGAFSIVGAGETISAEEVGAQYFNAVYVLTAGDVTTTSIQGDDFTSDALPADRLFYGKFLSVASDAAGTAVLLAYHFGG